MNRASSIIRSVATLAILAAMAATGAACSSNPSDTSSSSGTIWSVDVTAPSGSKVHIVIAESDPKPAAQRNVDPGWSQLFDDVVQPPYKQPVETWRSSLKVTVTLYSGPGPVSCT